MLNAILVVRSFIFNAYCFKDLKTIFIVIFMEGSSVVIENLLYIRGYEFVGFGAEVKGNGQSCVAV